MMLLYRTQSVHCNSGFCLRQAYLIDSLIFRQILEYCTRSVVDCDIADHTVISRLSLPSYF